MGSLLFRQVLDRLGLWWSADGDVVGLRGRKQVLPILEGGGGEGVAGNHGDNSEEEKKNHELTEAKKDSLHQEEAPDLDPLTLEG